MIPLALTTQDAINLGLFVVGIVTLAVGIYYNYKTRQQSLKTERASAYLALEMHSSEIFKFEADNYVALEPYRSVARPSKMLDTAAAKKGMGAAENLYFQTLNLFEVCTRFRKDEIIDKEVYSTWVPWFYDTLRNWCFREKWRAGMRENYTPDLQAIFDGGVAIFCNLGEGEDREVDNERRWAFYKAVADHFDCGQVRRLLPPHRAKPGLVGENPLDLRWAESAGEREEAAVFFAKTIGTEPAYISHGEIQAGLSADGRRWIGNLESRFSDDLANLDATRGLVIVRADGDVIGAAIVQWAADGPICFGVVEDLAVAPAFRARGVGRTIMEAIEREAQCRGLAWLFLESGLENHRAHAFFEGQGYTVLSKVFGKRLDQSINRT